MNIIQINLTETPHLYGHNLHRFYAEMALENEVITEKEFSELAEITETFFNGRRMAEKKQDSALSVNGKIHLFAVKHYKEKLRDEIYKAASRFGNVPTYKIGTYGKNDKGQHQLDIDGEIYAYEHKFIADNLVVEFFN